MVASLTSRTSSRTSKLKSGPDLPRARDTIKSCNQLITLNRINRTYYQSVTQEHSRWQGCQKKILSSDKAVLTETAMLLLSIHNAASCFLDTTNFLCIAGDRAKMSASPLGTSPILHGLYSVQYSLYLPTSCILHVYVISWYRFRPTPTYILLLQGSPYMHPPKYYLDKFLNVQ